MALPEFGDSSGAHKAESVAPASRRGDHMTNSPPAPPSFDGDIKPLFRERDRTAMLGAFDLWSYADVRNHGAAILSQLRSGTMPCDGAWPSAGVDLFARWLNEGTPE
jgi:hypothetical protein